MANQLEALKKAKAEIGTKEYPIGSNKVKYNTWFYGREVSGADFPWCCAFICWLFDDVDFFPITAYCPTAVNWYKQKGAFDQTPEVGAVVFYNFNGGGITSHIGIVESVNSDGTITAIEGNTSLSSNDNGGAVMRRIRAKWCILGYGHPDKAAGVIKKMKSLTGLKELQIGSTDKDAVRMLQIILRYYHLAYTGSIDGDFGTNTRRAVTQIQSAKGLTVDGIVGENTWAALLEPIIK